MHIDSVRELKGELLRTQLDDPRRYGIAARARSNVDRVRRTLSVGVTPFRRSQYRLALRVQTRGLVESQLIERIRRKAKGEIDLRYVGRVVRQAPWGQFRVRPLRIGISVGHHVVTAGTVGCFVTTKRGEIRLLSNNHVLANENSGKRGDEILQPGSFDGGRRPRDVIGTLDRFVRLKKQGRNRVDVAVAELSKRIEFVPDGLRGAGKLAGVVEGPLTDYERVEKLGRTTGRTRGRITAFELDNLVVSYDLGNLRFDDQIEIEGSGTTSFSRGGDSGSLIFTSDERLALGLLFAGSDQGGSNGAGLTYANPFPLVLETLRVDLAL
jgi:hypothetical protein